MLLEKIYDSGNNTSLFIYIIISGLALILILIIILTSVKPKKIKEEVIADKPAEELADETKIKEEVQETVVLPPKETDEQVLKEELNIISEPVLAPEENDIEEVKTVPPVAEENDYSSVYLDIKPQLESVPNKIEEALEDITPTHEEVVKPEIKEEFELPSQPSLSEINLKESSLEEETEKPLVVETAMELPAEDLSINPQLFADEKSEPEVNLFAGEEDLARASLLDSIIEPTPEIAQVTEGLPEPEFKKTNEESSPDLVLEKPEEIEKELEVSQIPESSEKKIEDVSLSDLVVEKPETEKVDAVPETKPVQNNGPIVLTAEDIKSKLAQLSSLKSSKEDTLDDILKHVGLDNNPEVPNLKNEESIILGR